VHCDTILKQNQTIYSEFRPNPQQMRRFAGSDLSMRAIQAMASNNTPAYNRTPQNIQAEQPRAVSSTSHGTSKAMPSHCTISII